MKRNIFLIVVLITISANSQDNLHFLSDYWVKSKDNNFIFAIDKIENDSLQMNYYGHLYTGKIKHTPNYISAEVGGVGKAERLVKVTFYTDERKGTGTIINIGTNKDGSISTANPIELFNNKFKFIVNNWVDSKHNSKRKFTVTKITPDSLYLTTDSRLFRGKFGRSSNSIQGTLYEKGYTTNPLIITFYTGEQRKHSSSLKVKGNSYVKERAYKETHYILESVKNKELEKNKIYTEKLVAKKLDREQKERLGKIKLKQKRSLLTESEINNVQTNLQELSKITDELVSSYKEIKRYGRYATLSMIKNYNSNYSKWIKLYNSGRIEKRPEHMTENQEVFLLVLEQVLMKQKLDSNFKKILNSNY